MADDTNSTDSYSINLEWDDKTASYVYVLVKTHASEAHDEAEYTLEAGRGDRVWATRIAQHYGIELDGEPAL